MRGNDDNAFTVALGVASSIKWRGLAVTGFFGNRGVIKGFLTSRTCCGDCCQIYCSEN